MSIESGRLVRAIRALDAVAEWTGRITAWLILPLVAIMVYEVVVRHVARPTQWAYDLSYMAYGALFMLGAGYTLLKGAHIRTDFLYQKWPLKVQAAVDAACYLLLFFPGIALFLWFGADFAWNSWQRTERTVGSSWMPVIYPLKAVLPIAAGLLLLQGLSEFLKCLHALRTGAWLTAHKSLEEAVSEELKQAVGDEP
jgi:TRAP-type mannitol/chloroaromatic compound transport system permease small subunit